MGVNYCNGDLHRTEREASVANQKTGNVSKDALNHGPECILHLNQLLCSGLKVFNSLPYAETVLFMTLEVGTGGGRGCGEGESVSCNLI